VGSPLRSVDRLQREHRAIEDTCFEALADRVLSDGDDVELVVAFDVIDRQSDAAAPDMRNAAITDLRATVAAW